MNKCLRIEGLNCAACASKIETKLKNVSWLEDVNLNFTMGNLNIKVNDTDKFSLPFIQKIVDEIEDGVLISDQDSNNDGESFFVRNLPILKLIISVPFFISGLLIAKYPVLQLTLLSVAYIVAGYSVLIRAFKNILNRNFFDEFFLMSIATIGAFFVGEFSEGVGVMIFFQIGEFLQDIAVGKSKKSIQALLSLKPDFARTEDGELKEPESIKINDIIEVRPGEKVPLDGLIIKGNTEFDTKTITGESLPKNLTINDSVLSGYINISQIIKVKVTKEFKDSTITKIIQMVQNETSKKTKTENFITKFSKVYTPIVVITALIIALLAPFIIKTWSFSDSVYRGLIFLVISCPCALVISVPLGYFGGIGRGSKAGILIKGSTHIDLLTEVTKFAFDKTGTLTWGKFSVKDINTEKNITNDELIKAAVNGEIKSNHPIAKAIIEFSSNTQIQEPDEFTELSGKGTIAKYGDEIYICGKKSFLQEQGIYINHLSETFGTEVYISKNREFLGVISLVDKIKEDANKLVETLGKDNIYMLTGDNRESATYVANKLKIKNIKSELLPVDKADFIKKLNSEHKTLFVGDGINDAPVLAASTIGISMGGIGSDAAIEASDIVIMTDEPSKIIDAIKIAKFTKNVIKQNIAISLGFKSLIMILGLTGITGLWLAIFADVGVSLIAVINSIRTLNYKID